MDLKVILLWVFIIIILYFIISYFFGSNRSNLTDTVTNAQTTVPISAASLGSHSSSSNYAYSIWFNVNDWNYKYGEYKVLFGRMGQSSTKGAGAVPGLNGLDPCPAVLFDPFENNLIIHVGCFPSHHHHGTTAPASPSNGKAVISTCTVSNVPLQRWTNLVISVYGRTLDVYINGKLVKTQLLHGTAYVNGNSDVYLTPNGGFSGYTSKFQYFPSAIDPQYAWNIYENGYGPGVLGSIFGYYSFKYSLVNNSTGDVIVKGSI